uniref:Uncharacterized protein n=1 Tax=Parascaris equorum TaxID=6256 RepID=A0A914RLA6_PAREQ
MEAFQIFRAHNQNVTDKKVTNRQSARLTAQYAFHLDVL